MILPRAGRTQTRWWSLLLLGTMLASLAACRPVGSVGWAEKVSPQIRINQLGYFVRGPKWAVIRSQQPQPIVVELVRDGQVVWRGNSLPKGADQASGEAVHHIDFSEFAEPGKNYRLRALGDSSFPFSISDDIYASLPREALHYFYHNRSGVPIVEPFVEDRTFSRPAGHLSDARVPCWLQDQCSYQLDVSGGWYDAGDHGKYVVNGGISAWTLLALYERLQYLSHTAAQWGDGSLNIPESTNGAPDLLDEARFEVEFLLKMQVPSGHPDAGMVHHKIHDASWSPLGIEPPETAEGRALHPPSTAATLNLAAVAAQTARLYTHLDPTFSARCLSAARRAYAAAQRSPRRFAPELDRNGGGPYADLEVSDEFFWAAAELYLSTQEPHFFDDLSKSPHFEHFPTRLSHETEKTRQSIDGDGVSASMSWRSVAALGWISLAVVPSPLAGQEKRRLIDGILQAGDSYLEAIESEGYLLPLSLGPSKKYPWGSNSFVLNNMVVLSLAADLSGQDRYAIGVAQGMDYLLGRNPMQQSYLTGYGSVPLQHPHHRFWSHSLDSAFPKPPKGVVSGGPNSSLQDPQTKRAGLHRGLAPQKCFVDHIEAWSVNEVTINWNAPLAWVAVFLDEWRGGRAANKARPVSPPDNHQ